jgi:signal peptidase I
MTTDDGPRPVGATGAVPPTQSSPAAAQVPPLLASEVPAGRRKTSRSRGARRGRNQRRARKQHKSFLRELPGIVITALVISVLIKTFLVQAFYIPSGSMENTLLVNDRVLVNKLVDKPDEIHRGDVVVFRDPGGWLEGSQPGRGGLIGLIRDGLVFVGLAPAAGEEDLIKRVIGVGGDKVACCDAQGRVTVNGVPLDEPYLFPGDLPSEEKFGPYTVPPGELWVMGDHRSVSEDSRAHRQQPGQGFVPVKDVIGRAFTVVWPLDRARLLHRPATFDQPGLASGP